MIDKEQSDGDLNSYDVMINVLISADKYSFEGDQQTIVLKCDGQEVVLGQSHYEDLQTVPSQVKRYQ